MLLITPQNYTRHAPREMSMVMPDSRNDMINISLLKNERIKRENRRF
jgi:hypothetical protein